MGIRNYLPSAQFTLIVGSIAVSGGLVLAAQTVTHPSSTPSTLATTDEGNTDSNLQWKKTLQDIQDQTASGSLPTGSANPQAVEDLLSAAKTSNVTNTVARTLLINLSQAKSQGLGSDIPTQDALVAQALSQINQKKSPPAYATADLTVSSETSEAYRAYGNGVITALRLNPDANYNDTILAIGSAVDSDTQDSLAKLAHIQAAYRLLAQQLVALPVPPTLRPFHLQVVNDLAAIAASYDDMKHVLDDPLRGLAGFQLYQALSDELGRVFINIAQTFSKDGILFDKDEPGSTWASFLQQ